MKRFKNILLVLRETHNDRGIERAVNLAKKNDAQLTLIQPPRGQLTGILDKIENLGSFGELRTSLLAKQREKLKALCDSLDVKGAVGVVVPTGSASEAIIKQVLRNKHDLVITTAQGNASAMGGLLKSLSLQLIRKCPCPVWIIHPERQAQGGQVLAAVDLEETESGNSVNSLIIDLARSLAQINHAKLHIVNAYYALELDGYASLLNEYGLDIPDDLHKKSIESAIAERKRDLDSLLQNHSLETVDHEIHLVEGMPSRLIPKIAKEQKVDVLVLGVITHSAPSGHFIGAIAEDIVHQIDCSVLAVKPPEFVSPVEI